MENLLILGILYFVWEQSQKNKVSNPSNGNGQVVTPPNMVFLPPNDQTPTPGPVSEGLQWHQLFRIQNFVYPPSGRQRFGTRLIEICKELNMNPHYLMGIMWFESKFEPTAKNDKPGQTATGLIQFIEKTANDLGTTTAKIYKMTAYEQLKYVRLYYMPFRSNNKLQSLENIYLATFLPISLNWPDSREFSNNYKRLNPIFVINGKMNRKTIRYKLNKEIGDVDGHIKSLSGGGGSSNTNNGEAYIKSVVKYSQISDLNTANIVYAIYSFGGKEGIKELQLMYNNNNYSPSLLIDGLIGPNTLKAINSIGFDLQKNLLVATFISYFITQGNNEAVDYFNNI